MITEQDVRRIIREENQKEYTSGTPEVPPHQHNGVDNLSINSSNVIIPVPVNGTIDMNSQKSYTLNLSGIGQIPRMITFYGSVRNTNISPKVHALVIGSAQFGNGTNQQFQPGTSSSVVTGTVSTKIIQGCCNITIEDSGNTISTNSQGHIIYVEYGAGTIVCAANVTSMSNSSIIINVIILASNWEISGLWTVT